ncbi:MAG: bifunctional hydroxymethylpyrimidine kinase/phosphomethylpyrimidine kinase [Planctomycetes bacterium]|nr:bifunctional hydroxymethylpyrimidine kinase/phosphomethylpyrimidine kinase [Planctomycetota bacterium]
MPTPPSVLCIAGFDPSAGAGIVADAKTCAALGVYAATAMTALTVQNTRGVQLVQPVEADLLSRQLAALIDDFAFRAVKIGMLCEPEAAACVAKALRRLPGIPAVLDPVAAATSGARFWGPGLREVLLTELLPLCAILTPNLPEAAALLQRSTEEIEADPAGACAALRSLGAQAVLLKGGHRSERDAVDLLDDEGRLLELRGERIETRNAHGTGCTLSSAIAAELACGLPLEGAVRRAKRFVAEGLRGARDWRLGGGRGPLAHFPPRQI